MLKNMDLFEEFTAPSYFECGGREFHRADGFTPGPLSDGNAPGAIGYGLIQCGALYQAEECINDILQNVYGDDPTGCAWIQCDTVCHPDADGISVYEGEYAYFYTDDATADDVNPEPYTGEYSAQIRCFEVADNFGRMAAWIVFYDEQGDELHTAHYWI